MRTLGAALLCSSLLLGCPRPDGGPALSPREQARKLFEANRPDEALALLEKLFAQSPRDFDLARELVGAHVRALRTDELFARYQAHPLRDYLFGLAWYSRAADVERAIASLRTASEKFAEVGDVWYRLGIALLESERYEESLPPLQRAAELTPERSAVYLPLAKALHRNGDPAGAMRALRRVIESQPTAKEVATARALADRIADPFATIPKAVEAKLEQGMRWLQEADVPQQAIIAFEEILRDYPDLAVVRALVGLAYQQLDDAGRAVEELKRAIELAPQDGKNHLYLGDLYYSRQRVDAAAEHYRKAIELHPLLDMAYLRLGEVAAARDDFATAEKHFRTLALLRPDDAGVGVRLATVYLRQGKLDVAERELMAVLQKAPDSLELKLQLGLLHMEKRSRARTTEERRTATEQARKYLTEVITADPDNAFASRALETLKQ